MGTFCLKSRPHLSVLLGDEAEGGLGVETQGTRPGLSTPLGQTAELPASSGRGAWAKLGVGPYHNLAQPEHGTDPWRVRPEEAVYKVRLNWGRGREARDRESEQAFTQNLSS